MTEGPPRIYVPICKHPKDFMFTFGPLGYELVEQVDDCPIIIRTEERKPERTEDEG